MKYQGAFVIKDSRSKQNQLHALLWWLCFVTAASHALLKVATNGDQKRQKSFQQHAKLSVSLQVFVHFHGKDITKCVLACFSCWDRVKKVLDTLGT